jgi:putative PIN family toxin of toxin-antitoxin system
MRPGLVGGDLVRAVLDVNVLISAALSAKGQSAEVLRSNRDGAFELIISELLIAELARALRYPKIRKRVPPEKGSGYISWVRDHGILAADPIEPAPLRSPDPDDDYLLALAISRRAFLVTGDQHLLGLRDDLPILTPAEFLTRLREQS